MKTTHAFVLAGMAAGVASADIVIDNFDNYTLTGSGTAMSDDLPADVELTSGIVSDVFGFADQNTAVANVSLPGAFGGVGAFVFSTGSLVVGEASLAYDFSATDLSAGMNDGVEFTFFNADLGLTFDVMMTDSNGMSVSKTITVPSTGGTIVGSKFATFSGDAGFDITSVTSMSIDFNTTGIADLDFVLTDISAVNNALPSPGSMALIAVAGGAFALRRRG